MAILPDIALNYCNCTALYCSLLCTTVCSVLFCTDLYFSLCCTVTYCAALTWKPFSTVGSNVRFLLLPCILCYCAILCSVQWIAEHCRTLSVQCLVNCILCYCAVSCRVSSELHFSPVAATIRTSADGLSSGRLLKCCNLLWQIKCIHLVKKKSFLQKSGVRNFHYSSIV